MPGRPRPSAGADAIEQVVTPFRLYDSMRRQKVAFEPLVPGKVGMYVCGPTTYAAAHIGHAYSAIAFDTVRRALTFLGWDVTYVRNVTDIDDKIIKRAPHGIERDRRVRVPDMRGSVGRRTAHVHADLARHERLEPALLASHRIVEANRSHCLGL